MPTLYTVGKDYKQADERGRVNKNADSIMKGVKPVKGPPAPGYRILNPDELAGLNVPVLDRKNGDLSGYQRPTVLRHGRRIARAIARGEEQPPIMVSIVNGAGDLTDGQHRALGAIIARTPIGAIVKHRTENEAKKLFANQRSAKPVSLDTIVLAAHGLFAEYVQDACTSNDHAWSGIVSEKGGHGAGAIRISPSMMFNLVSGYCTGALRFSSAREGPSDDRFNRGAADLLAELLLCFGSRKENPLAWQATCLRASTATAVLALRRTGEHPRDVERWKRTMSKFPFARYAHIRTARELSEEMVAHWNKRLGEDNRISVSR